MAGAQERGLCGALELSGQGYLLLEFLGWVYQNCEPPIH